MIKNKLKIIYGQPLVLDYNGRSSALVISYSSGQVVLNRDLGSLGSWSCSGKNVT